MGRLFSDEETAAGTGARVAVLSHAVWTVALRRPTPGVLGRTLVLNGLPHAVIGVTAADYQDPFGPTEVWLPVDVGARTRTGSPAANPSFGAWAGSAPA